MFDDLEFDFNPMSILTAGVGLVLGLIMLKFGGLTGMGIIGKIGMILGSTIGGFIAGVIFFRD